MPTTKTILYLDASAFKESACQRRLGYIIHDGIRENKTSPSLAYGTAVHKFVATLRETGGNKLEALNAANKYYLPYSMSLPDDEWRNLMHLNKTCQGYFEEVYRNDVLELVSMPIENPITKLTAPTVLIEQKFAIPIYEDELLILMLSGTVDEIGKLQGTGYVIVDRKTSSDYYKADAALKVYEQSTQLMFYKFIVEQLLNLTDVKCYIEGIFLSKTGKTKFQKSAIFEYPKSQMDRFEEMLNDCVNGIVKAFHSGDWKKNYLICDCTRFANDKIGLCKYFDLCANDSDTDKTLFDFYVKKDFVKKPYNPLLFDAEKT